MPETQSRIIDENDFSIKGGRVRIGPLHSIKKTPIQQGTGDFSIRGPSSSIKKTPIQDTPTERVTPSEKGFTMENLFDKCEFNPSDFKILENIKIIDNIERAFKTGNPNLFNQDIDQISGLLLKYNFPQYKCAITEMDGDNKNYKKFCEDNRIKKQLEETIDLMDKIIDHNDNNLDKVINQYIGILQSFEKDCYKREEPILVNKIKKILGKIAKIFYKCEDIVETNNTQIKKLTKEHTTQNEELMGKAQSEINKIKKEEKEICQKKLSDLKDNEEDKYDAQIDDMKGSRSFFEVNYLVGWILTIVFIVIALLIFFLK